MHQQRDLFRPFLAETFARQEEFFTDPGPESDLTCVECGRRMVFTESGYLSCPMGHGRLKIIGQSRNDDATDAELFAEAADACRRRGDLLSAAEFERLARLCNAD